MHVNFWDGTKTKGKSIICPRGDLSVNVGGVTLKPALALGGWVAFKAMNDDAMVMGDVVLLEDEISPVMLSPSSLK